MPPRPAPPSRPLPFRAFLRVIRSNALTMWTEEAYERDVLARRFLGRSNILLNSPAAIHHVLVDNYANYRRSPASIRILKPITGHGLLLSEGESWKLQRRTVAPALAPRVMPMLARHIARTTQEQVALMAAKAGPVDLLGAMQLLALEVAGRAMFSLEMQNYGAAMRGLLAEYGVRLSRPNLFDILLPAWFPTLRDLRRRRFQARWMRLMEQIMRERLSQPEPETPRDLFDLLRGARDPETGQGFSPRELRDQLATLILAGHETTAVTIFWALTLLAQDQAEQQRVAAEAHDLGISEENAGSLLSRLARTRAVVSETLRLYPPAFTIVRQAIGPDRCAGIEIPRGSIVMIAPWVLHRHHHLWCEPDSFDSDRFMPGAPAPARFAYLPFGAGPRVCVGAQFALTEATLVLAAVIQRFQVILLEPPPMPVAIVTTQPEHPPLFELREREAGS
ncbi:MAG: cytochrome P450 [Acetobacteraceae bacterium]|nr:cytochrome P450 [Acetobacteraceae bacterium]